MELRKATPGEGGEGAREQFTYFNTPAGLKNSWTGWLACDPYWFIGHEHKKFDPGTQPCLHWISDGELRCVRCARGRKRKKMCYLHIYREFDGKPVLVVVQESAMEVMGTISFRSHVLVGRLDDQATTFVKPTESQVPCRPTLAIRQRPIDTALSLLGIWKIPELTMWCQQHQRRAPQVTSDEVAPGKWRLSVPPPTTATEALSIDAEKKAPAEDTAGTDDALERVLRRTKKAERNGQHERPEE